MMCTVHCRRGFFFAALAQPAEHPAHNRVVAGSIPARGMICSRSSIGRALVSKTRGCRLSPCRECQLRTLEGAAQIAGHLAAKVPDAAALHPFTLSEKLNVYWERCLYLRLA